jgi:putative ABC transport system permease protein
MIVLPEVYGLTPCEIVGVVKNVDNLVTLGGATTEWALYVPLAQDSWPLVSLALRSKAPPARLIKAVHKEILAVDPGLPLVYSRTMNDFVRDNLRIERALSWNVGSFALIGFVLTLVGIGSVVGHAVSQRTHEIGVRMALGATRLKVLAPMLKHGMVPVAIGLLIGLAASIGLHRLFWSFFWSRVYGITKNEPITFGLTIAAFAIAALIGCWLPARRATKVDPIVALRYE